MKLWRRGILDLRGGWIWKGLDGVQDPCLAFFLGGAADEGISVLNSSFLFCLHADRLWFFNGSIETIDSIPLIFLSC